MSTLGAASAARRLLCTGSRRRGALARLVLLLALCWLMCAAAGCDDTAGPDADEPVVQPPRAADYRSSRVQRALDAAAEVVRTRGFAPAGEPWRGFLVDHAAEVRELPMRAGTCYLMLAAGSSAIRELKLRIFDSDGGEVVQDASTGPSAALRFCPSQSGTYYLAIQASAGSGLCGVRFFRGPTGLEIRTDDLFREEPRPEAAREGR